MAISRLRGAAVMSYVIDLIYGYVDEGRGARVWIWFR